MTKTNYHTHTERCNHATGSDEGYVQSAISGGYQLLGLSDHTPWPFSDGYTSPIRMRMDELDGYVLSARALADRYRDQIEIKVGLECEYYPDYMGWLAEQRERLNLDFLIFGNHYPYAERDAKYFAKITTHQELKLYLESSIKGIECGMFDCFAHPELFMRSYPQVDDYCIAIFRDIALAARECDVALELNTSIPIFHQELWQVVAEVGPKVIIGMDAHERKILKGDELYSNAVINLNSIGIEPIYRL
ncbi:MAG: histidinol-phosphatase [Rikenellaceae bacterium]